MLSLLENLHIVLGLAAAGVVFLPLLSQKGGKLHVWSGRFFVYSMTFIGISALILASLTVVPSEHSFESRAHGVLQMFIALFLLAALQQGIGVFRYKVRKRKILSPRTIGFPLLLALSSFFMMFLGLWSRPLYSVIGGLALILATYQLLFWIRTQKDPRDWWPFHLTNMFVGGTLALVALNLEVVSRVFDLSIREMPMAIWLSPAYFMMPWMFWERAKYKSRRRKRK